MSHLKKIIKWVVNVLTAILLIILILVIYGKCVTTFTSNAYPNYFGYTLFEVASGSMEPALYTHDVILIDIGNENLKNNDIIAFQNENSIITHRIVFIDGDTITVKGDNNNTIDSPINKSQVIGKVVKVFPKLSIWKKIITEPKILIAIFITLLLFDFALSYKDNSTEKISKKLDEALEGDEDNTVLIRQITNDEQIKETKKSQKNVIEGQDLLELTRKIDLEEINKLLENPEIRLNDKEITKLKQTITNYENRINNNKEEEKEVELPKLNTKQKEFIEYTMRLDLNQIQKKIKNKIK